MKTPAQVRQQLASGQFEFSRHAFRRAIERDIGEQEIREVGAGAEVVENCPDDKYSPSGLLLGVTVSGRPLKKRRQQAVAAWAKGSHQRATS